MVKFNIRSWSGSKSRVKHVLLEIPPPQKKMYSYAQDLEIGFSVLCVNITQIDQYNLIGGKKVNENISI